MTDHAEKTEKTQQTRSLSEWQALIMGYAESHGWNQNFDPNAANDILAKLMLVTTEVAEAAEDVRTGAMLTEARGEKNKPEGFPTELADVIIRVLHLAALLGIDLESEVARKHAFNLTRAHRHGGLRA